MRAIVKPCYHFNINEVNMHLVSMQLVKNLIEAFQSYDELMVLSCFDPYYLCSNRYSTPHCSEQNSFELLSLPILSPQFLQIAFLSIVKKVDFLIITSFHTIESRTRFNRKRASLFVSGSVLKVRETKIQNNGKETKGR